MRTRKAGLCATLLLLAAGLSGCFAQPSDGLFGPGAGAGADVAVGTQGALSIRASPARGPAPLEVTFTLSMQGDGQPWALDFGDGSAAATGKEMPATVKHTYGKEGSHVARFRPSGGDSLAATVAIIVLAPLPSLTGTSTTDPTLEDEVGPPPPEYQGPVPPPPPPSSSSTSGTTSSASSSTSATNTTSSNSTSSSQTSSPSNSTSATGTDSSTQTSTSSGNQTSSGTNTTSTTETSTFSDPGSTSQSSTSSDTGTTSTSTSPSPSDSPTPSDDPTPSESQSESGSSTDPPL